MLSDLTDGLRECGWQVDTLLGVQDYGLDVPPGKAGLNGWRAALGHLSRTLRVPYALHTPLGLFARRQEAARQSTVLGAIRRRLETIRYDGVLACVDGSPVGFAALVTRLHPRTVLLSLFALGRELRARRLLGLAHHPISWCAGGRLDPELCRPVDPASVTTTVFASQAWRDGAVAAGLPASAAKVIYFGVAPPEHLGEPVPPRSPARLLWAARLTPEKGLHLFLPAVARLRHELPIRLTIMAGFGSKAYRCRIERMIRRLKLTDIVHFDPPVRRAILPDVLASHDVFLFNSEFREPVAQTLLVAFASGLVVVGPRPRDRRSALKPDRTAFCFTSTRPRDIASAIRRSLSDLETRSQVRTGAFEVVRTEHSLASTIRAYNALLTDLIRSTAVGTQASP